MEPNDPTDNLSRRLTPAVYAASLVAVVLLSIGWRAYRLETPALDQDEVYEVTERTLDLGELIGRHDGFPPLYRWLVSAAIEVTGAAMATRWFSLAAGVATIVVVAALGRRLAGPAAGLASAAMLGVSANHVLLSQHGRGYTLLILFASLMMLTAWRLRDHDRWRDWWPFLVFTWLAIATHYYAGLLLLLLGPMLLIEKRGAALRRGLLAAVLLAIAGLPLVVCLKADMAETGEFFHRAVFDKEAYAFSYLWLITGNTLGPSVSELREYVAEGKTREALLAMAPWAVGVAVVVGVLLAAGWGRLRPRDRAWLAVLLVAPPLMLVAVAPITPTGYQPRYIVWMVVPLVVGLAAGATSGRPTTSIATVGLVGLSLLATVNRHTNPRYFEHDYHAVVRLIESRNDSDLPPAVVTAPLYYGTAVRFALPAEWLSTEVTANPRTDQDWDVSLPAFREAMGDRPRGWLVTVWHPEGHPKRRVCDRLVERLNAELIERVSPTEMVYEFDAGDLR